MRIPIFDEKNRRPTVGAEESYFTFSGPTS
jgi:hypothetical protein